MGACLLKKKYMLPVLSMFLMAFLKLFHVNTGLERGSLKFKIKTFFGEKNPKTLVQR